MNINPTYISKYNLNHEIKIIVLMIPNRQGRPYFAVKKLSALLRKIMTTHVGGFHFLNCLHLLRTKINFNLREII